MTVIGVANGFLVAGIHSCWMREGEGSCYAISKPKYVALIPFWNLMAFFLLVGVHYKWRNKAG